MGTTSLTTSTLISISYYESGYFTTLREGEKKDHWLLAYNEISLSVTC